MKIIICPICGTQFETNRPNKKYCSFSCKEAGRQLRYMKWTEEHPHYSTEYMRKYREKIREKNKPKIGACENKNTFRPWSVRKVYLQAGATENKAAELWRLQRQNAKH